MNDKPETCVSGKVDRIDIIRTLRAAHDEIIVLRRRVAELEPAAKAYATIEQLAQLTVKTQPQGYGEDVAWRAKDMVERLDAERRAEKAGGGDVT